MLHMSTSDPVKKNQTFQPVWTETKKFWNLVSPMIISRNQNKADDQQILIFY